jgi:hypothetical protein
MDQCSWAEEDHECWIVLTGHVATIHGMYAGRHGASYMQRIFSHVCREARCILYAANFFPLGRGNRRGVLLPFYWVHSPTTYVIISVPGKWGSQASKAHFRRVHEVDQPKPNSAKITLATCSAPRSVPT